MQGTNNNEGLEMAPVENGKPSEDYEDIHIELNPDDISGEPSDVEKGRPSLASARTAVKDQYKQFYGGEDYNPAQAIQGYKKSTAVGMGTFTGVFLRCV